MDIRVFSLKRVYVLRSLVIIAKGVEHSAIEGCFSLYILLKICSSCWKNYERLHKKLCYIPTFLHLRFGYLSGKVNNNWGDTMSLSHGPIHTSGLLYAGRCNL